MVIKMNLETDEITIKFTRKELTDLMDAIELDNETISGEFPVQTGMAIETTAYDKIVSSL